MMWDVVREGPGKAHRFVPDFELDHRQQHNGKQPIRSQISSQLYTTQQTHRLSSSIAAHGQTYASF